MGSKENKTTLEKIQDEVTKAAFNAELDWDDIREERKYDLWPFVCKRYLDQGLAEYKAKLKEDCEKLSFTTVAGHKHITMYDLFNLIDTTEI